jgi:hypothetical protein
MEHQGCVLHQSVLSVSLFTGLSSPSLGLQSRTKGTGGADERWRWHFTNIEHQRNVQSDLDLFYLLSSEIFFSYFQEGARSPIVRIVNRRVCLLKVSLLLG